MMNSLRSMAIIWLLLAVISPVAIPRPVSCSDRSKEFASIQSGSLSVMAFREEYDWLMAADFTAPVGGSQTHYGFVVSCSGANSTDVQLEHTNPQFEPPWTSQHIECGSSYLVNFTFRPVEAGFTVDNVTFSSSLGTVTKSLIGNGFVRETPPSWEANLGEGVSAQRLVYDRQRDRIYVTDSGNDQVIIFDPVLQSVIQRISVGPDPVGLAVTPNGQKLYVANSGEHTLSVIDLDSQIETDRITIPTLYPNPSQPFEYDYRPYEIAIVSDTLALLGSIPPGLASGGPIYEFDLVTGVLTPRGYAGICPVFRTSFDFDTTGIIVEPQASPTEIVRYNSRNGSFLDCSDAGIRRSIAVNNNGTRLITTDGGTQYDTLVVHDQWLRKQAIIMLLSSRPLATVTNPVSPKYVYTINDLTENVDEARLDTGTQTRELVVERSYGYGFSSHALTISDDGMWIYALLNQTWDEPPSKLLAIQVGPTEYTDSIAPISEMDPLPEVQTKNWWILSWVGSDDSSGVDYYDIQVRVGEVGEWSHLRRVYGDRLLFSGAKTGQVYYFRMSATDRAGNIEYYPDDFEIYTTSGSDTTGLYYAYLPMIRRH